MTPDSLSAGSACSPVLAQSLAMATTSSAPRGAKQLVVDSTHSTLSGASSWALASRASKSAWSSSPSSWQGTQTGVSPAAVMHFRHVFWSTRGHSTCRALLGCRLASSRRVSVSASPGAGRRQPGCWSAWPARRTQQPARTQSNACAHWLPVASLAGSKVEELTFGCSAEMFPERPMPCARP